MKFTGTCCDCGLPTRNDVKRCRECYTIAIRRGVDRTTSRAGGHPLVESDEDQFARMDAKFCKAMKQAIEAGLERP